MTTALTHVPAGLIDPGPNDRGTFDARALDELAASIAAHGLAQPPTLRPVGDRYEIVAGERRTRAMRDVLGWELIPALVRGELDDEAAAAIMLAENVVRADLDPLEEARAYSSRAQRFGYTVAQLAEMASVPASRVRARLALLNLADDIAHYVSTRALPLSFAACMTTLDSNRQHLALAAYQASPLSLDAFKMLCGRLQVEQDQDSIFDADSFLQVEEYVIAANAMVAPAPVAMVREPVLGAHEAAELLGVKRTTVHQWAHRRLFPSPDLAVGAQPAWYRSTVVAWAAATGRPVAEVRTLDLAS